MQVLDGLPTRTGGYAVLSPGASISQAYKKPPVDLMAAACTRLARLDVTPLVVWGPGEETDARSVVDRAPDAAVYAPPTTLGALAALLERSRLFVGGDTGPLHMACAVGCPVVGIYGPTDPLVNQPWGVRYRVVAPPDRRYTGIKRIDREAGGFDGITADQLTDSIDQILTGSCELAPPQPMQPEP
jgi:heptosyltransferase-1